MSASVSVCPLLGRLQTKPEVHPEWASLVVRKEPCPTRTPAPRGVCPVAAFQMALRTLALRLACSVSFHSHGCSLRSVHQPSPCTDGKSRLRKAVYLSVAPARCLSTAFVETLCGDWAGPGTAAQLRPGQGRAQGGPSPGRAASAGPSSLGAGSSSQGVVSILPAVAADPMPGTIGVSVSRRLPFLPVTAHLILQTQEHSALGSSLSCLKDFCPSLWLEINHHPSSFRNLLQGDPNPAPCPAHVRSHALQVEEVPGPAGPTSHPGSAARLTSWDVPSDKGPSLWADGSCSGC